MSIEDTCPRIGVGSFVAVGAFFRMALQRTLRIPDDGRDYPLPPGLGNFPIFSVERYADHVPDTWRERGGFFIPMHQREALWLSFSGSAAWHPTAIKVAAGGINAVSGGRFDDALHVRGSEPRQDYLVVPDQPWLDGHNVGADTIRQFVAVPLGSGHTVEGQVSGHESVGGIQLLVVPAKAGRFPTEPPPESSTEGVFYLAAPRVAAEMGLGAGGTMRQRIAADRHGVDTWDPTHAVRLFIHIANAELFSQITGLPALPTPVSAETYTRFGYPWFDLYEADAAYLGGADILARVRSLEELDAERIGPAAARDPSLDIAPGQVIDLGPDRREAVPDPTGPEEPSDDDRRS